MASDLALLTGLLATVWFIIYWLLGGALFALLVLLRLGRVRKVRFGCLYTLFALAAGVLAAHWGVNFSSEAINLCLADAHTKAEAATAVLGCGSAGIFGAFAAGAGALILGGLVLLTICRRPRNHGAPTVAGESTCDSSSLFS